ncbi:MAG TPA: hypothetical protein DEF88_07055 [Porphyromonadaceae bacterium]|nr:hypothetical protein [Porphyromonadaceae bacterium]HCM19981.1 hypothetical protein [Porphyromonadaceae bacterium]
MDTDDSFEENMITQQRYNDSPDRTNFRCRKNLKIILSIISKERLKISNKFVALQWKMKHIF